MSSILASFFFGVLLAVLLAVLVPWFGRVNRILFLVKEAKSQQLLSVTSSALTPPVKQFANRISLLSPVKVANESAKLEAAVHLERIQQIVLLACWVLILFYVLFLCRKVISDYFKDSQHQRAAKKSNDLRLQREKQYKDDPIPDLISQGMVDRDAEMVAAAAAAAAAGKRTGMKGKKGKSQTPSGTAVCPSSSTATSTTPAPSIIGENSARRKAAALRRKEIAAAQRIGSSSSSTSSGVGVGVPVGGAGALPFPFPFEEDEEEILDDDVVSGDDDVDDDEWDPESITLPELTCDRVLERDDEDDDEGKIDAANTTSPYLILAHPCEPRNAWRSRAGEGLPPYQLVFFPPLGIVPWEDIDTFLAKTASAVTTTTVLPAPSSYSSLQQE